jgi:hypothetical protein
MPTTATVTKKVTPVLMVQAIEPCLALWVDRLGWTKVAEVPHGDKLGFVILVKDGLEIMYQTFASIEQDTGKFTRPTAPSVALFLEVADLDAIIAQIDGLEIALPRRKTFYGMDEIGVREAGGHLVMFAQPIA